MSARPALMPPGLRELLGLLGQVAELPPMPADSGDIGLVNRVAERRASMVRVRLALLADELDIGDKYPSVAAENLTRFCERTIEALRAEPDMPLGYKPKAESR